MAVKARKVNDLSEKPGLPVAQLVSTTGSGALDRVIHDRTRLGIVSALAAAGTLSFNDLKKQLSASDGNLSVHARKLEEAGYILCKKGFEGRVPRTEYRLTSAGRTALRKYISHMEALIDAIKQS